MSELFDVQSVSQDSPRKKWIKKHSIESFHTPGIVPPWAAWSGPLDEAINNAENLMGYGNTEDEAITDWAKHNDIRLWNET